MPLITHSGHLSTLSLLQRCKALQPRPERVYIVAARPHLWRAHHDARLIFPNARVIPVTPSGIRYFSRTSTQWFTQRPLYWWIREIPIRVLTVTLGRTSLRLYKKIVGT